jgi:hypothetical protein
VTEHLPKVVGEDVSVDGHSNSESAEYFKPVPLAAVMLGKGAGEREEAIVWVVCDGSGELAQPHIDWEPRDLHDTALRWHVQIALFIGVLHAVEEEVAEGSPHSAEFGFVLEQFVQLGDLPP